MCAVVHVNFQSEVLFWKIDRYFLLCNKKSRFDFADELKVGYVRYKHLTQITIKVQLFWRFSIWNVALLKNEPFMSYQRFKKGGRVAKSQFLEKSVQK